MFDNRNKTTTKNYNYSMANTANQPALRFKDKVAIVTGGVQGIGRGCVDVFGK
jgi:hypothetical protein